MHKLALALIALCTLSSCMTLLIKAPESDVPVSFSGQIRGYRTGNTLRHLEQEIWVYQVLGLPKLPSWTREGLPPEDLIAPVLKANTTPGQGLVRLKVRQSRSFFTWMATILTLGLISTTAVNIDGDIVELQPEQP